MTSWIVRRLEVRTTKQKVKLEIERQKEPRTLTMLEPSHQPWTTHLLYKKEKYTSHFFFLNHQVH